MSKLEKLAVRIGEISEEIKELKSQREINLEQCHGSEDEEFITGGNLNCLYSAYDWVKTGRGDQITSSFDEILHIYGCLNCIGAHKAKRGIGLLKQERGRIVGNISKIGKSL